MKRIFTIPLNNLTPEEVDKLMQDVVRKFRGDWDWRENFRKEKRKERVTKLNKIFK